VEHHDQPAETVSPLQSETEGRKVHLSAENPSSPLLDNKEDPEHFTMTPPVPSEAHSSPYPEPSWDHAYMQHRLLLCDYVRCRLFSPTGTPEVFSDRVVCAVLDNSLLCYPVRISNIASPFTMSNMLAVIAANNWGTVLAISTHIEPDATISMDIGLQHVEDALLMWCRPGVQFDQRPWVFEAITAVAGDVVILPVPDIVPRDSRDRLRRLQACLELEERLPSFLQDQHRLQITRDIVVSAHSGSCLAETGFNQTRAENPLGNDSEMDISISLSGTSMSETGAALCTEWINLRGDRWHEIDVADATRLLDIYTGVELNPTAPLPSDRTSRPIDTPPKRPFMSKHQQVPTRTDDGASPANAPNMNSRERGHAYRSINRRAKAKYDAWISPRVRLPDLPAPELLPVPSQPSRKSTRSRDLHRRGISATIRETKHRGTGLILRALQLWDWYDRCLISIEAARQELEMHGRLSCDPPANPEETGRVVEVFQRLFDDMAAAFSPSSRLTDMFGREYLALEAELAKRKGTCHLYSLKSKLIFARQ
jgi:hypothetical protein